MTSTLRLAAITVAVGALMAGAAAAAQAQPAPAGCDTPGCDFQGGGFNPQGWNHWEYHQHDRGGPGWQEGDFGALSTGSAGGPGSFNIG